MNLHCGAMALCLIKRAKWFQQHLDATNKFSLSLTSNKSQMM